MPAADLAIQAHTIIPVRPRMQTLENHTILIKGGKITALIPSDELDPSQVGEIIDCRQQILMPGLINSHTHMAMNLLRGLADDLPLMTWLQEHIFPAEAKWVSESFVRSGTQHAVAEMLKGGTTCFNDMYFFPEAHADVAQKAGMRGFIGITVFDFPCAWGSGPDEYFAKGEAFIEYTEDTPLIQATYAPHAPYTVSDENLKRVRQAADKFGKRINIHLHETEYEIKTSLEQYQCRPTERLHKLGLLGSDCIAVHMTAIEAQDLKLMQSSGTSVVTCPESNLKLASGYCPVHQFHEGGVNVAIGTDGACSNNDLDMFSEMRTTAILAKAVANEATAVSAMTALEMATLRAARALGVEREIGTLEVGKQADIIALDVNSLNMQPLYNPISQVVYAANSRDVRHVWVNGESVVKDRELTRMDESAIIADVKTWQEKIRADYD